MPRKWHWKWSSCEHVANAVSATDLAGITRNKTEDDSTKMFIQLQSWILIRSPERGIWLSGQETDDIKWKSSQWKNTIFRVVLHRPVHHLWFYLSSGLNHPGVSRLNDALPNLEQTYPAPGVHCFFTHASDPVHRWWPCTTRISPDPLGPLSFLSRHPYSCHSDAATAALKSSSVGACPKYQGPNPALLHWQNLTGFLWQQQRILSIPASST